MKKQTIMIVEDDSFVMDIYQTKLTLEGFAIIAANNGIEALKKLESGDCNPDLILLDIVMPFVNGLEVLKKIKDNDKWNKIPVILLTNLSQKEEIGQGFVLGAKDYLIKSHFTPSEVLEKIRIYLPKSV
jgi:DNA-binding response OmpR family regulator